MIQRALILLLLMVLVGCSSDRVDSPAQSSVKTPDEERVERLRKQYPFESLEARLPGRSTLSRGAAELSRLSAKELEWLESEIGRSDRRELSLRALHDGSVAEFVSKKGFGVWRTLATPEDILANARTASDPSELLSESWKEVDVAKEPVNLDLETLNLIHHYNTYSGINRAGFGLVKSRKQVAGFQSHRFQYVYESRPWKVRRVELVGILVGESPRVYVTAGLPRMEEVRKVPTRELDAFESTGLAKLQGGEFVFIREGADGIRMLGAIRSAKQCLNCHEGERGDLLGAFSYSLHREPE